MAGTKIRRIAAAALAVGALATLSTTAAHATDGKIRSFQVKVNVAANIDAIYIDNTTCYYLPRHTAGYVLVPNFTASNDRSYDIGAWEGQCDTGTLHKELYVATPPILDKDGTALSYWWVDLT